MKYSEELIKKAKNNKEAFGLIEDEELKAFLKNNTPDREGYYSVGWLRCENECCSPATVYRLNPDYEQEKQEPREAKFEVDWNIHPACSGTQGRLKMDGCEVLMANAIFKWRGKTYRLKHFEFAGTIKKSINPTLLHYNNSEAYYSTKYATHGVYEVLNV